MDDSGSDGSGEAFVLAGYVATDNQWINFSTEWSAVLKSLPRIEYFKMKEANSLRGQFWGWSQEDRNAKVSELVRVVKGNVQLGVTCTVWWEDLKALSDEFGEVPWKPYPLLFHGAMAAVTQYCIQHEIDDKLRFVFGDQGIAGKRAAEVHEEVRDVLTKREKDVLGSKPVHLDDKIFLPLQAADLIAWQTRRYIEENKAVKSLDQLSVHSPHLKELELVPTVYKTYGLDRLREMVQAFGRLREKFKRTGQV